MDGAPPSDLSDWAVRDFFDPNDQASVSERVVRGVATLTNTDPVELPALYDSINPDALDALYRVSGDNQCEVCFEYAGTTVYISELGDIHISDTIKE